MDAYRSQADTEADKAHLMQLHAALNAANTALRLDECRLWAIRGSRGHAATWGDGRTWLLVVHCRSKYGWAVAKRYLAFAEVTQDGDDEGVLRLLRLPTPEQAITIRKYLGVRQTRDAPANAFPISPAKTARFDALTGAKDAAATIARAEASGRPRNEASP